MRTTLILGIICGSLTVAVKPLSADSGTTLQTERLVLQPRAGGDAGDVAALPELVAELNDPNMEVRMNAARAIGELGVEGRTAIPALLEYLSAYEFDYVLDGQYPGAIALEPIAISTAKFRKSLTTDELRQVIADLRAAEAILPGYDDVSTEAVRAALPELLSELESREQ